MIRISNGRANSLDREISEIMSKSSNLDLSTLPLLKLLYLSILKIQETIWDPSMKEKCNENYIVATEIARMF